MRMNFFYHWKNDGFKFACWNLWDNISYPFYRFFKQTKTLFQYLPIIWRDRDWDSNYILYLLRYKLDRMQKEFQKGQHVGCEIEAQQMRRCIRLIDRITKDEYFDELLDYKNTYIYGNQEDEKDLEKHLERCRLDYLKAEEMAQRDWDVLFSILHKKMRRWWD